jgi:hypothetical protein
MVLVNIPSIGPRSFCFGVGIGEAYTTAQGTQISTHGHVMSRLNDLRLLTKNKKN